MDRRYFIRSTTLIGTASLLPINAFSLGNTVEYPCVLEVEGSAGPAVGKIFDELGGLQAFLPNGVQNATVLIKPNICLPHEDKRATTTSSELVGQLCIYLKKQGVSRIIIADHTLQDAKEFTDQPIVTEASKHSGVKILLANEQQYFTPVEVKGKVLLSTEILKLISKVDLFINLPTAKHHSATHVSLGLKNLMGTIWDRSAFHTDLDLHQAIGDLALVVKPHLTITDATGVLLKGGPIGPGPVVKDNRYFASQDIVAVDSVVASRYSFNGQSLPADRIAHIRAAYENGVGEIDPGKIEVRKFTV